MTSFESVSIAISLITLLGVVTGGVIGLLQWNESNKNKRAEIISSLVNTLRDDSIISNTIYMFDYEQNWYNDKFHHGELEGRVDRTLSFYSYICYLRKNRIISKKDIAFFEYEIRRIASNWSVEAYLYNLYHFSKKNKAPISFEYLFKFCDKRKMFVFCNDIKQINDSFPKYLNF